MFIYINASTAARSATRCPARWERCTITNSTEVVLITITNTFNSTITKYRDVLITTANSTDN